MRCSMSLSEGHSESLSECHSEGHSASPREGHSECLSVPSSEDPRESPSGPQ